MSEFQSFQIQTGARLHFGLLNVVPPFGGVGLMVNWPSTELRFSPSNRFDTDEVIQARAEPIAQRLCETLALDLAPSIRIEVVQQAESHVGFGSGTQLSMAITEGLCRCAQRDVDRATMARIADRGRRSAIGVHGYFEGGFLYEGSDGSCETLNPLRERLVLPEQWRVVIVLPIERTETVAGTGESRHFQTLAKTTGETDRSLAQIVEREMLPAAGRSDFEAFSSAVSEYNHQSGMLFSEVQGGPYNGEFVTKMIHRLNSLGVKGVGQSSWGPCVFGWCQSQSEAKSLAEQLNHDGNRAWVATTRHHGRCVVETE